MGVPLAFFFQFWPKNLFLNFWVIAVGIYRGILKVIKNDVCCAIIWLNAPKMGIEIAIFVEWAEQAFLTEPCCHLRDEDLVLCFMSSLQKLILVSYQTKALKRSLLLICTVVHAKTNVMNWVWVGISGLFLHGFGTDHIHTCTKVLLNGISGMQKFPNSEVHQV